MKDIDHFEPNIVAAYYHITTLAMSMCKKSGWGTKIAGH